MESLKTNLIGIAVVTFLLFGVYLLDHRQSGSFWLTNFVIFGLYSMAGYFYDRWKLRRLIEKARQEANLQKTV